MNAASPIRPVNPINRTKRIDRMLRLIEPIQRRENLARRPSSDKQAARASFERRSAWVLDRITLLATALASVAGVCLVAVWS
jgi:hypothetical protein